MKDYYLFLTSNSTASHIGNNFLDFTVEFPYTINLSDKEWQLGLLQISFFTKQNTISPNMYVCCDIITSSFCDNETLQILRFIPCHKGRTNLSFRNVFYQDVLPNSINKIRIYIKQVDGTEKSFKDEILYCTLHLKQKEQ